MSDERTPKVAVIGRQNVGKSTLVNRLFGRREAIAHGSPGVTRDRVEVEATWRGRRFSLVDTAGYLGGATGIHALTTKQADMASAEADLILLVVDARAGITEEDATLARRLRRSPVPVVVVANKVDTHDDEADAVAFNDLGLGEPLAISSLHGRAAGDLLDRIIDLLPSAPRETGAQVAEVPRFAIVGRPNVGKSSLFNKLVGEERSVVFEEAGTTRDSVDALVQWPGGAVRFIDTAGMRREVKVRGLEYFSFVRATQAIERAHVGVLVIDATEGFAGEDKKIATRIMEAGRAFLLVANKWDLVEQKDRTYKELSDTLVPFARASVLRTSAIRGQGVPRLPAVLTDLHARWARRVPTAKVNEIIHRAQAENPTPRRAGTMHYATQVSSGPPTFVIFGGAAPDAGYQRFIENRLRQEFGFGGVPIRLRFRPRTGNRRRADPST
ncbi:MAG: ribosome biogenesis GTPase Der [Actinomycetota bacterium]|nr:ribosome biogenesis GTPase Der [Actinomycetota bacterium]